jgi:hypothetical protein
MVKDQEEKVQKPPDLPTICTKECTRSVAPTLVMTDYEVDPISWTGGRLN